MNVTHAARARHRVLAICSLLVALSAIGGAVGLITGGLSLTHRLEQRLPFASPVLGGIALAILVGMPFGVLASWAWRGDRRTAAAAAVAGWMVIAWILVELAFIRELSFFHPLYVAIGAAFVVAGRWVAHRPPSCDWTVDREAVDRFLRGHRIVLVGASADPKKFAGHVVKELRGHGYDVVPVNRRGADVFGVHSIPSVLLVDGDVDGAIIMVTGDAAVEAVRECAERGIRRVWLFRGVGTPGAMSDAAVEACHELELDVVAGACPLMFLEPVAAVHRVHLTARRLTGSLAA